ncbi:MAG: lytic transglycosylase domain-containing protein [Christensenellales bacterium]
MKNNSNKYFAFFVVLIFAGVFLSVDSILSNYVYPIKYYDKISTYCTEFNVDESLVLSIIKAESDFDENAVSYVGAKGLMQLMPNTATFIADKIGVSTNDIDLFDSDTNLHLGIAYLSYLMTKFKNIDVVICAYNAGEGEITSWIDGNGNLKEIKFEETENYINKVKQAKIVYDEKLRFYQNAKFK